MRKPGSPRKRCGSRLFHRPGRCRMWPVPGKQHCKFHFGASPGRANPKGCDMSPAWKARAAKQALMKALGLPWYGGQPPKGERGRKFMAKAIVIANEAIERLPAPRDRPDSEKREAELLGEGMRAALILGRDTVLMVQKALDERGEDIDYKLLNLGNTTGATLCRLGLRSAEVDSRAKRDDVLGRLLAAIEAEKAMEKA